jgi:prephenate dehydratase
MRVYWFNKGGEMSETLAYLGPEGTYTWEAALKYRPNVELFACNSIRDVFQVVLRREVDFGIVPMKNSIEGTVNLTADLLVQSVEIPRMCGEVVLPIHHSLVSAHPIELSSVKMVSSHPQALAQCTDFIEANLPIGVVEVEALSTMAAVRDILNVPFAAAIASARAVELFNATILAENIEDVPTNATRFVVLGMMDSEPTNSDKTSMFFRFKSADIPGSLRDALSVFADRGINLTAIESRPTKENLGDDIFLVDADGHIKDQNMIEVISELVANTSRLRVFGSYPKAE